MWTGNIGVGYLGVQTIMYKISTEWNKSDRQRQISYDITYMWNLKKNGTDTFIYKTEVESHMWKRNLWSPGVGGGRGEEEGDLDWHIHTTVYKTDN